MTVPILLNGETCGTLEIRRDGAYTLFEARCERREELVRLWAFGEGGRGYLGVLQPEGEGLSLRRRLSRAAMRAFPQRIEYAGGETDAGHRGTKAPAQERETEERPDGCLLLTEGKTRYLALPCALRRAVPGTRLRTVEGRTYLLFRC